jgi:signal peptidase II
MLYKILDGKINFRRLIINIFIIIIIFLLDRISKIYIINLAELNSSVDIYLTSFLNLYLVWNSGIAFGLLSFDQSFIYNTITILILIIILIILIIIIKSNNYKIYFLSMIMGGALGNLFDRIYYSAVPDFIDLHLNNFHWFIFNVADIFISIGVICLILDEIFIDKLNNNEKS